MASRAASLTHEHTYTHALHTHTHSRTLIVYISPQLNSDDLFPSLSVLASLASTSHMGVVVGRVLVSCDNNAMIKSVHAKESGGFGR